MDTRGSPKRTSINTILLTTLSQSHSLLLPIWVTNPQPNSLLFLLHQARVRARVNLPAAGQPHEVPPHHLLRPLNPLILGAPSPHGSVIESRAVGSCHGPTGLRGEVHHNLSLLISNPVMKGRHMKDAVAAAKRASELERRSVEFSRFYAGLLFERGQFEMAVVECQRGVRVGDPVDPALEMLGLNEGGIVLATPEARIDEVREELRSLIQKCETAISTLPEQDKLVSFRGPAPPDPTAEIKSECERSLRTLHRGNHTKALKIIQEALTKHKNSALLHRVHGAVHAKLTTLIQDPVLKQRHLKAAVESAKKATELAPNSLEYSYFYASLLFDCGVEDAPGYELAVSECERGINVEHPVDPMLELLHVTEETRLLTPEARINQARGELRTLIQKCNIATISTWMKTLGDENNRYRLISIPNHDPTELRTIPGPSSVPSSRNNKIKNVSKTREERRKEIEVRLTAHSGLHLSSV